MSSIETYRGNMRGLTGSTTNNQSNLRIAFNMGLTINCDICKDTIKDCVCFCNKCRKCLHPRCAGVEIQTVYSNRDGRKQIVLPAPEELPLSCRDCLRKTPMGSAITDLLSYGHQGGSPRALTIKSSITRFLESSKESAHKLVDCIYHDRLIHTSDSGHELEQRDHGTVYSCFGCKEKGFGSHHACKSASCSFCLHEECVSPRTTIVHPFFPGLTFVFSCSPMIAYCNSCRKVHSRVSCNACGMDVNGYFYESLDGENHLHPCCAHLPRQIIYGESEGTMVLQQKTTAKCCYCGETKVKVDNKKTDRIWSYVSQYDNYQLHVPCIMKMLSYLDDDSKVDGVIGSSSRLTLHRTTGENGVTELKLDIAGPDAKKKWEERFGSFMKYVKIALGAIIAAFLGDPTTFIINFVVAFVS